MQKALCLLYMKRRFTMDKLVNLSELFSCPEQEQPDNSPDYLWELFNLTEKEEV